MHQGKIEGGDAWIVDHGVQVTDDGLFIDADAPFWELPPDRIGPEIIRLRAARKEVQAVEWLVKYVEYGVAKFARHMLTDLSAQRKVFGIEANPYANDSQKALARRVIEVFGHMGLKPDRRTPSAELRRRVIERDGGVCRYCGSDVSESVHLDHVVPHVYGGRTSFENLVTSCRECNSRKSDRLPEDAEMELLELGDLPRKRYVQFLTEAEHAELNEWLAQRKPQPVNA